MYIVCVILILRLRFFIIYIQKIYLLIVIKYINITKYSFCSYLMSTNQLLYKQQIILEVLLFYLSFCVEHLNIS